MLTAGSSSIDVQRQPGANVIRTVDAIKAQLPALQRGVAGGVKVDVLSDRTTGIRASVWHVQLEMGLAVLMVVLATSPSSTACARR